MALLPLFYETLFLIIVTINIYIYYIKIIKQIYYKKQFREFEWLNILYGYYGDF